MENTCLAHPLTKYFGCKYKMPCIMTRKIVSNKVFPRQLLMMMQLKVVAVWVFLLVSIAGLTEGK